MFKPQPNPTFEAVVGLSVAGQEKLEDIKVEFKYLNKPALSAFFGAIGGKTDAEALAEIIVGWNIKDYPYSEQNLADLLDNYPAAAKEFFETFRKELMESKRKN